MATSERPARSHENYSQIKARRPLIEKIINHMKDGIASYDLEGRYTFWNESMEKLTGKSADEVVGRVLWDVFPFLKTSPLGECIRKAMKGERSEVRDAPFSVEGTGRNGFVDANYEPLYNEAGEIDGAMAVVRDVTDRYHAQKASVASELKFRSLTQNAQDAIIMCDSVGAIQSWNIGAKEIFQYTEAEAMSMNVSDLIPGFTQAALKQPARWAEIYGMRKAGSRVPMDVSLSTWNSDGKTYFSILARDVSDRKHLEAIAEERENLHKALLRAQSDLGEGVVITSFSEGKILYVNDTMSELFGYTHEELLSLRDAWLLVPPDQLELLGQRHQARMERNTQRDHVETIGLRKDGSRFHMEFAMTLEELNYGPVVVNIIRDISKRKQAELELAETKRFTSLIVQNASDIIATYSLDGNVKTISPSFETMSGWKVEEWLGKNMFSLVHPDDVPKAMEDVKAVFDGHSVMAQARCLAEDGH